MKKNLPAPIKVENKKNRTRQPIVIPSTAGVSKLIKDKAERIAFPKLPAKKTKRNRKSPPKNEP
jgi:hypothetical protein